MTAGTLVVQTAFLGDVILTLPLVQRLAEQCGPVDVVTTPLAVPLVATHPAVRQVIPFDKQGRDRGLGGLRHLAARLRATDYSRAFLPHRSLRSAALARLAGIPERIGFGGQFPSLLYTTRRPWPATGPMVERYLSLIGSAAPVERPWLHLTAEDRAEADRWLTAHGITGAFTALAPGSRWGTKRWPHYPALAATLSDPIVVIGDAGDRSLGEAVVAAVGDRAHNACGALTLRQSAAIIERATQLVTNDSAPLHLATALARPVVAIFGPTVPAFGFAPIGRDGVVVEHPAMPCRPCSPHGPEVCPLGHHRCMTEITVGQVVQQVATLSPG